jgi:hypothetical protein
LPANGPTGTPSNAIVASRRVLEHRREVAERTPALKRFTCSSSSVILEILADEPVHDAVDPLVAAQVRLALDALLDPAGALACRCALSLKP